MLWAQHSFGSFSIHALPLSRSSLPHRELPHCALMPDDARAAAGLYQKKKKEKKIDYSTTIIAPVSGCLSLGLFSNIFSILFIFPSTARAPLRFCVGNDGHLFARWKRDKIISRLLRIHHDDDNGPRMDEKASWIEYIFFSTSLSSLRSALVAAVWHNRENEKSHRRRLLSRCCSDFESIKKLTS